MGESLFGKGSPIETEKEETVALDREDRTEPESDDNGKDFLKAVDIFALNGMDVDIRTYSPLALAFLGDAVYSLFIRTTVVARGNRQAEKLHNETTRMVQARKQSAIGKAVYDLLSPQEQKIYRRGRNSHPMHHARGASLEEYLHATALETLCGYLFLQGETERIAQILRQGIELTARRNGELMF